jgi:hypothetical protein
LISDYFSDYFSPVGGGTQGAYHRNDPGTATLAAGRRELGAPAGDLPFTGLLLWLLAAAGVLLLTIGAGGRQLTTA